MCLDTWICQKTLLTILDKTVFVSITSVSFKMNLESQKWTACPVPGAPVLERAGALGLIGAIWLRLSQLVYVFDNIFIRKRCLPLRSRPFIIENRHAERSHRVKNLSLIVPSRLFLITNLRNDGLEYYKP